MNIYRTLLGTIFLFMLLSAFLALAALMQMILERKDIVKQLKFSPMLTNSWSGVDVLFVGIFFVTSYAAGSIPTYIIKHLGGSEAPSRENLSIIEYSFYLSSNFLIVHLSGFFLCSLFVSKFHRKFIYRLSNACSDIKKDIKYGFLSFARIFAPVMATSLVSSVVLKQLGYEVEPQEILIALSKSDSILINTFIAFVAIFVAPIFEELIFRGIFFPYILKYVSIPVAVFVVSAVFAAIHGHIPSFMPIFVLSCGLSMAYLRSGSIIVPITMHLLFNALNLALLVIVTKCV